MTTRSKRRALTRYVVAVAVGAALMVGCGARDEADRANKLVDEGNAEVESANKHAEAGTAKYTQAFDFDVVTDTSADWEKSKPLATEASQLFDQAAAGFDRAADKFSQAAKLGVDPKFKEYLDLKSRSSRLRAEHYRIVKERPQSLFDASIKDGDTLVAKITENEERAQKIVAESERLEADAEKIRQQNTEMFEAK